MQRPRQSVEPSAAGRVARNTVVRALGEVVAKLASLAFFVVLARRLGSEGFGAFSFALALTGALLIASGFGTDDLVAREVARDRARAGRDLADVALLKVCTSMLLLGVAMVVVFVGGYPADTRLATLLVGTGVALEVLAKSWHALFEAEERLELVSICLIVQRTLTAGVGVTVLLAGGRLVAASGVFAAGALAGLAAADVARRRAFRLWLARPTPRGALRLLRGGVPIGVAGVMFVLLLRLDVTLLSFVGGNAEVGLYAAAFRLVEGCQFISWAFGAAMMPWLARGGGEAGLARGFMLGLKFEAALLMPIGLVLSCFAASIVQLLYGHGFAGSVTPLGLLGLTVPLYGLVSFSTTVLIARDAPAAMARSVAIVCLQNLACNAVAIPLAGAKGAAAVALASSLLLAALSVRQAGRRVGGVQLPRTFAGPLAAGAAMAAVALAVPLPAVPAGVVALVAYAAVLAAVELTTHRDDVRSYLTALPARLRLAAR